MRRRKPQPWFTDVRARVRFERGARLAYPGLRCTATGRPFQDTETPVLNRLELLGQGFDFGRDAFISTHHFTNPNYTAGARFKLNEWVTAGVQAEDIAETTNMTGVVNVSFEDRDIAYLLGFVSFKRAPARWWLI